MPDRGIPGDPEAVVVDERAAERPQVGQGHGREKAEDRRPVRRARPPWPDPGSMRLHAGAIAGARLPPAANAPARRLLPCGSAFECPEGPLMIVDTLACLLLVLGVAFGLSRLFVDRLGLAPAETPRRRRRALADRRLGVAWAVFISGAPLGAYWLLPALPRPRRPRAGAALGDWSSPIPAARDLIARPADRHRLVRRLALLRQGPFRRRLDRRLGRALGAGALLPARTGRGPAVHRHLPASRPPAARQRPDRRVHADDAASTTPTSRSSWRRSAASPTCPSASSPAASAAAPPRGWPPSS